jgi:thiamine biosynthesis lipoprotein
MFFILQPILSVQASFLSVDKTSLNYLYRQTESGYDAVDEDEQEILTNKINAMLTDFENIIGLNVENSDTNRINAAAAGIKTMVSNDTAELFELSERYFAQTNGAFNIATFNLTKLWGFSSDNSGSYNISRAEPSAEEITQAKELADVELLVFYNETEMYSGSKDKYIILYNTENPYIVKSNSDIKIDFGGIAKGYICDRAGEYIKSEGIDKGALKILSNIYILGNRVENNNGIFSERNFTINIENPRSSMNNSGSCLYIKNISNNAVTTSADNYRYYIYNDKIYSHIINPFTGKPSDNGIISISVFTDNGAKADAYSTAGFVMGLKNAIDFYELNSVNTVIITADYKYYITGNLEVYGIDDDDLCTYEENENAPEIITNCDYEKTYLGFADNISNNNFSVIISAGIILLSVFTVIILINKSEK